MCAQNVFSSSLQKQGTLQYDTGTSILMLCAGGHYRERAQPAAGAAGTPGQGVGQVQDCHRHTGQGALRRGGGGQDHQHQGQHQVPSAAVQIQDPEILHTDPEPDPREKNLIFSQKLNFNTIYLC